MKIYEADVTIARYTSDTEVVLVAWLSQIWCKQYFRNFCWKLSFLNANEFNGGSPTSCVFLSWCHFHLGLPFCRL